METRDARYFAWCAGAIAGSLAFVVPAFAAIPIFWYYPLAHRWRFEVRPSAFALDWYGRTSLALVVGAAGFGFARVVAAHVAKPSERAYRLWALWALLATLLSIAVYAYQLAHRHPVPEPLPAWYVPR